MSGKIPRYESPMADKVFYKRKLPHWQPAEGTFFVTYRLAGSLPMSVINSLKEANNCFTSFEAELEKNYNKLHWLKNNEIAEVVMNSLLFNNNKLYELWAGCIMSNHVHTLLSLLPGSPSLQKILQNHKKFTAVHCNKLLDRTGPFWAEESFDTLIRNEKHFSHAVNYIIDNPVKAGLVNQWTDWKWTYIHPNLDKRSID